MGFDNPCPIHFTDHELAIHKEEGEGWNEVQDFWQAVSGIVARDGWTPNDRYEDALELFRELRDGGLKSTDGKESKEFKKQMQWVDGRDGA